jgi:hypothetical protein
LEHTLKIEIEKEIEEEIKNEIERGEGEEKGGEGIHR